MGLSLERLGGFKVRGDDAPPVAVVKVDGRWCTVVGGDGATVELWDLEHCARVAQMRGHVWEVTAMAAAVVDGRPIAVSGGGEEDFSVRLWDLVEHRELAVLDGHAAPVYGIGCAEVDGRPLAVTGSWDGGPARVWDLREQRQVGALQGHTGRVHAVACTRIGCRPHAVTTGYDDHTLQVWDLATGARRAVLEGHSGSVLSVDCTRAEGRTLAVSTSSDRSVRFWDLTAGSERQTAVITDPTRYYPTGATCLIADGRPVAAAVGYTDHRLHLWDMDTAEPLATVEGIDAVNGALASALVDGQPRIVSTAPHGGVGVWTWRDTTAGVR